MDWLNQLGGILQRYSGASADQAPKSVHSDFEQIAQSAPRSTIADGLAAAFRSDRTPPFAQMVSHLFTQSNEQQQSGILNTLITAAGPALVSRILDRNGVPGLAQSLGRGETEVNPEQVQQIPPSAVKEIAAHAEDRDPSVVDQLSHFYAQHPTLVKTLGTAALTVALSKIAQSHSRG